MVGDVLLIGKKHERVARELTAKIKDMRFKKLSVGISGESGSGKSEIAEMLRKILKEEGYKSKIISLDNYYKIPPDIRNEYRKRNGVDSVGIQEIDWAVLNENIEAFRLGTTTTMPYIDLFTNQEDKLVTNFADISILIVEGLYACYSDVDVKVFIDLTYHETKKAQIKRQKEKYDDDRLKVLEKEHKEVQSLRDRADYLVSSTFHLIDNTNKFSPLEDKNDRVLFCSAYLPLKVKQNKLVEHFNNQEKVIHSIYSSYNSLWFGVIDGVSADKKKHIKRQCLKQNYVPLVFKKTKSYQDSQKFGYRTVLPLFHYSIENVEYNEDWWNGFVAYNLEYYKKIKNHLREGDVVWIHDYQLMLLPSFIRHDFSDIHIGFFLHTAFPSFEVFQYLPWAKNILNGLLGADLIGFRSYDYVRHFQSSLYRLLGKESKLGNILVENRLVHVDSYSVGVDFMKSQLFKKDKMIIEKINKTLQKKGDKKTILSFENMNYNFGLLKKINFIDGFFQTYPELQKIVNFHFVIEPFFHSAKMRQYKEEIIASIQKCNQKYKQSQNGPITISFKVLNEEESFLLYNSVDMLLLDSMNDDANFIIKEYVASQMNKNIRILSSEFISGCIDLPGVNFFNPNNEKQFAHAILSGLNENITETKYSKMLEWLERHTSTRWAVEFFEDMKSVKIKQNQIKTRRFSMQTQTQLLTDYFMTKKRLLIFDYNGTLTPLTKNVNLPPPNDVLRLLKIVSNDKRNKIVVLSDTNKEFLELWFKHINIDLMACSDVAIKRAGGDWMKTEHISDDWKNEVSPILEKYNDRSPGAYVEEKGYSLIWHFEKVTKELGEIRSRELMDELLSFTEKDSLQVHEGERLIEIKNAGLHKGKALQLYFDTEEWDFVIGVGDDWTNEMMFEQMPDFAYSIKIGPTVTHAKYTMKNRDEFIVLLQSMTNAKK